ncbi:hypothetical protein KVR01_000503 [Diaporthe batatas]|uniref:uncharacterized protein n=1 Tax=Diaporthe batatas TaxID=748121 RepID=UPI001D0404E2|nr:uncharacterized protein KVR01_000503 [Diaporthe batatas]KAG8169758.1 hypothetical protein KVR01_000503 [Diaporthe batatas]
MGASISTNSFPVNGRTVLITGGSQGTGREAAHQLAQRGANVVIVARDAKKLEHALQYISSGAASPETQRFHHISADLTAPETCARVIAETSKWNSGQPPDIVWCCAGIAHPTLFVDTDVSEFKTHMDNNYFTSVYMAHAILRAWLRTDPQSKLQSTTSPTKSESLAPRHIIFTSSLLAFYGVAGYAPYNPSKAALRSLSDSISQEMNLYAGANPGLPQIKVHTIFPATIITESSVTENEIKSDLTKMLEESDKGQTPHEVARKSIEGLENGLELITSDFQTRCLMSCSLGASVRGGLWKGLCDWVLGSVMLLVAVLVRRDMDRKVWKWGQDFGDSGMRTGKS